MGGISNYSKTHNYRAPRFTVNETFPQIIKHCEMIVIVTMYSKQAGMAEEEVFLEATDGILEFAFGVFKRIFYRLCADLYEVTSKFSIWSFL